jgi:hypothetical protein
MFNPELLTGVEGWLTLAEAQRLYAAACQATDGRSEIIAVEIGSWKGRSTIALAAGLRERGAGRLFAIDPHTGSIEHRKNGVPVDTFAEFSANVRRAGLENWVVPLRKTAHEARAEFEAGSVSVLFIDGSHEYADVLVDIDDWLPTLRAGAVVGFNDPGYPGVSRALGERVARSGGTLVEPAIVRGTLFMRYRPPEKLSGPDARGLQKRLQRENIKHAIKGSLPAPVRRAAVSALAVVRGGS